jgi:FkbM family methyltransferase
MLKHLRALRAIRRGDLPLDRASLARDYLRTQRAWRRGGGGRAEDARVAGARLVVPDRATFALLVDEIFVREMYAFRPARARPLILDAGANAGVSVLYFKTVAPDARVVAFEPDPDAASMLRANVERNGLGDVEIVEAALARAGDRAELYRDPNIAGSVLTTTTPGLFPAAGSVRAVQLSRWVEDPTDFVKIDVEGAEIDVLSELADARALPNIERLAIEYSHHHPDARADRLGELLSILESNGFGYYVQTFAERMPVADAQPQNVLVRAYRKN